MKNCRLVLFAIIMVLQIILANFSFAVRAYPFPIEIEQPDGTKLMVQLKGNEFRHFHTTEDGYLIKKNIKGFFVYATMNTKGEAIVSKYIAKNISKRKSNDRNFLNTINRTKQLELADSIIIAPTRAKQMLAMTTTNATPFLGTQKALVIMVNFNDKAFTIENPQSEFTDLLNQTAYSKNGGTGSARDYFMASSYGKFTPEFDVVGPYTLSHDMAYYGQNDIAGYDTLPQNMVVEACQLANNNGLDFSKYDVNNDGKIDNVFIYYAGYNEAEGASENTIWPHRWSIYPKSLYNSISANFDDSNTSVYFDGKRLYDYACTSELKGKTGTNMCGIGTFAHEFGHVLGLPDYYHTSSSSAKTLEMWSIMDLGAYANGGKTPPTYSAYDRFYLGYLTPQQVSSPANLTLYPLSQNVTTPANTNKQAYLLSETTHNLNGSAPDPKEFYIIEYRKKTGWDAFLPNEGMLIWHIDYNKTAWNNNAPNNYTGSVQSYISHMRVYLQALTGYSATPGDAFNSGSFIPIKWDGREINREIYNITALNDSMTFNLMPASINISEGLTAFSTQVGTPSDLQSISVVTTNLTNTLNINLDSKTEFDIKLLNETTWNKSISIEPSTEISREIINVRYNPNSAGVHTDKITIESVGVTANSIDLNGSSTDPTSPLSPRIKVGYVESFLQYSPTTLNSIKTKTLNIKTTDLTGDLTLTLSGPNVSFFSVSDSSVAKSEANGVAGYNIHVTYQPLSIGLHNAKLTITGGGLNPEKVINLSGTGM